MIQRKILNDLKEHLNKKEITLIVGPRQAGKTTLMLCLKEYLEKRGEQVLFLSLDFDTDRQFFTSQKALLSKIQLEMGDKRGYVFIDEIQRKDDAGIFLKGFYDMGLPYKLIVSGSGSMELKEKIHESLVGRKRIFELNTISFEEFVNFKTGYRYQDKLIEFFSLEKEKTREFFREYIAFGGYPRLILEPQIKEKMKIIGDIYQGVIEKDIAYLLHVDKVEAFSMLIKVLAGQTSKLLSYSELSSTLGISLPTVKNYLWYAQKTFIIHILSPFFRNIKKEITKAPMIYFYDLGLRNYAMGNFGNDINLYQMSFLFQNFIFYLLHDMLCDSSAKIHFWRTVDKAEVDFVIDAGEHSIPIEVKYKELKEEEMKRSLRSFIERYHPPQSWVINLGFKKTVYLKKTKVLFIPFYELIGMNWQKALSGE